MNQRSEGVRSLWSTMVRTEIGALIVIVCVAPAILAVQLILDSKPVAGAGVAAIWAIADWALLVGLHKRGLVRLPISVAITVAVVIVATGVICWG